MARGCVVGWEGGSCRRRPAQARRRRRHFWPAGCSRSVQLKRLSKVCAAAQQALKRPARDGRRAAGLLRVPGHPGRPLHAAMRVSRSPGLTRRQRLPPPPPLPPAAVPAAVPLPNHEPPPLPAGTPFAWDASSRCCRPPRAGAARSATPLCPLVSVFFCWPGAASRWSSVAAPALLALGVRHS